jgi:phytanoyl-CoA hydroxylase
MPGKTPASGLYPGRITHQAIAAPDRITDADVRAYHDQGFIAVEGVFTPDEVAAAKAGLTHLIMGGNPAFHGVEFEAGQGSTSPDPDERERFVRKCMTFVEYEARLKAMADHPVMRGILKRLLGVNTTLVQDMALLKPPHVGREKPWHQDTAYFLFEPPELVIGTWTALDPATPENGCMHVIPGSHKLGPQAHYHDRDCQLPDDVVDTDADVVVPLAPGGVLFFSGLLHHGTPPNCSASRRRALQFHYVGDGIRRITAERHAELFHEDGSDTRYAGCAAWNHPTLRSIPIADRRF